ncbi:MAG: helix-turn-helix domain-containing protein [Phycisphaerales bacterium]|nr:helix-turn-helix domain-containing protein [Phycisphaerales bacterium]
MSTYTTFGDYIREERSQVGLGLREASRVLGISASYLSRLEAGEFKPPSGSLMLQMAKVYQSDIKKLMDLAKNREAEVMAADEAVAPAVQAFYRLAHDQPPETQEAMLKGALDALQMPDEQKRQILNHLRAMLSRAHGNDFPRLANNDDGLFAFDIAPRCLSQQYLRNLARVVLKKIFGSEIPIPIPLETVVNKLDRNIILVVHDEIECGRLRDGSPAVLGMSRWSPDGRRRELVVHEELFEAEDPPSRRRANFTVAHELFHCIEHLPLVQARNPAVMFARKIGYLTFAPELSGKPWYEQTNGQKKLSSREEWREWQANTFAAELLMPDKSVMDAFEELFEVSQLIAEYGNLRQFADEVARTIATDNLGEETSLVDRFDVNPQAMAIRLMNLDLVVEE